MLDHTIQRLLESSHTDFEIIVIVGHDDPETTEVARQAEARDGRVRVVVDHHEKKNKPKAMNTALPHCRGDVVGVFDAEDQVHPELLAHVDHAFRTTGADVVQGGSSSSTSTPTGTACATAWSTSSGSARGCTCMRKKVSSRSAATPSSFGRTHAEADGWDPECLAEDCDLGVRLSSVGKKVVVAYDSDMVTREETPAAWCR